MKTIKLSPDERIIAVVPEICSDVGYGSTPTWVYILRPDGTLRIECIQPEESSPELKTLHFIGNAVCRMLVKAVPVVRENA